MLKMKKKLLQNKYCMKNIKNWKIVKLDVCQRKAIILLNEVEYL